jgi:hypothetical protein
MSVTQNFKYLLARMAFGDPAGFLMTFAGDDGARYLRELWNGLHRRALGDEFVPSDELGVELHGRVLLLRLPPSAERGFTTAIGVTGGATGLRVFCLEVAEPALVTEILADGQRDFGPLAATDTASFATRVTEVVTEPD